MGGRIDGMWWSFGVGHSKNPHSRGKRRGIEKRGYRLGKKGRLGEKRWGTGRRDAGSPPEFLDSNCVGGSNGGNGVSVVQSGQT